MTDFLTIAFILLVAGVVTVPIATRLGLGSVLGYLLAGMAISPLLVQLGVDIEAMQVFAEFGVVMMLFLVGLELEPKKLWDMRGQLLGLGGGQVLATIAVLAVIALVSGNVWQTALAIGMVLALSSTAIVVQTLTERGLLKSEGGQASFSVLLFQDVAVIPILAILPLLALPELASLGHAGDSAHAGGHGGGINLTEGLPAWASGLVTVGAVGAVVLIGNYLTRPVFRFIAATNLRELFTGAALLFVIGIALLMTMVGLSPALGTFLAGVVLANSEYKHELESDVAPFKGLLLGLFFITVGAGIDFALAYEQFGSVVFWAVVVILTKIGILLAIARVYGLKGSAKWLFSLSLAQAGEFGFVLIAFAVANFVLSDALADLLLLIVALTMLVTPLLFIAYSKIFACSQDEEQEADDIDEENPVIIAGSGRVGGLINRMLQAAGYCTTVIDYSSRQLEIGRKFGFRSYFGDATRPDLLHAAGIDQAKLLVVALDEREQIDKLVKYAVSHFPNLHIIARAVDRNHVYELWSYGCRDIIRETYDSTLRMGRSAYEALGMDRQQAEAAKTAFEDMDRSAMREVAELYDMDIPFDQNEALIAKVKELRAKWDPVLTEQMSEILKRGR